MNIFILGGDGFCGWPSSLHLSALGHDVTIVDNLVRRRTDEELGASSLTPIADVETRLAAWSEVSGRKIEFKHIDLAESYDELLELLRTKKPDTVVHFAEQRAAPYSMKSPWHKRYTVENNTRTTHNLLCSIVESELDVHVVHLGTMGVYGYGTFDDDVIPEGYLEFRGAKILHPVSPGSVYHMTKCLDQLQFAYYAKNDELRITDLHQGIVWGTETAETARDERLINRFDYDGDYGTVLNRFLMQAAVGYPLTVHGSGGQTRAFIHIRDTVQCVALAVDNPPERGESVQIINQMTEVHRLRDLAKMIADLTGAEIANVPNPRKELDENELAVANDWLLKMGLKPTTLAEGLLAEIQVIAKRYRDRADLSKIPSTSLWTKDRQPGVPDLEIV